jgi:hypothetical protein
MAAKGKRKVGRPTKYSPALAARICDAIAGGKFLADLHKTPGMPAHSTMREWLANKPDFRIAYTQAREASAEHEERRASTIRDAMLAEVYPSDVARVAIDTCLKLAKIRDPKTYGDRMSHDVTSRSDGRPVAEVDAEIAVAVAAWQAVRAAAADTALGSEEKAPDGGSATE